MSQAGFLQLNICCVDFGKQYLPLWQEDTFAPTMINHLKEKEEKKKNYKRVRFKIHHGANSRHI